jgi:hypothetical protein
MGLSNAERQRRYIARLKAQAAVAAVVKNPSPKDRRDVSEMYRKQAKRYQDAAIHFAKAYPLLGTKVNPKVITKSEINAAQKVVDAWMLVVSKLKSVKK